MAEPRADVKRAYPVDDSAVLLTNIYHVLCDIRDALTTETDQGEFVDYRDKTVEIPANSTDYQVVVSPAARVVYLTFNQDASFKVNSPSANQITHEASSEYEINGFRVERLYFATGDSDTLVNVRTLLTRGDLAVESVAARVQRER
jgi:hypothetical protein